MNIISDPDLTSIADQPPESWMVRSIFSHEISQNAWLKRHSPEFSSEYFQALIATYKKQLREIPGFDSFVSYGPGDGCLDAELLKGTGFKGNYIPIDISKNILVAACNSICGVANIPIALVADFEEASSFISRAIKDHLGQTALFSILGNAVGNADLGERNLLQRIANTMRPGDYLLLSVTMGSYDKLDFSDSRFALTIKQMVPFLAGGISHQSQINYQEALKKAHEEIRVKDGQSMVPGSSCLEFYSKSDQRTFFAVKRYELKQLSGWIESVTPLRFVCSERCISSKVPANIGSIIFVKDAV